MAIITLPSGILFSAFEWGYKRYDYDEVSEESGTLAARPYGQPRWTARIASQRRMSSAQKALWVSLLLKISNRLNHLALYDPVVTAPVGTMRGTMTLSSSMSQGAETCVVVASGQASATLKAGDRLQIGTGLGSQLVIITDDATANGSGVITLNVKHPARVTYAAGTAVAWDKPVAHFKPITSDPFWGYDAETLTTSGVELELLEQWQ